MEVIFYPFAANGTSPVLEDMKDRHIVPTDRYALKIRQALRTLQERPWEESLKMKRVSKLSATGGQDLYELRIRTLSSTVYRLLFVVRRMGYIALHFFLKKQNGYYTNEIAIALSRLKKYDYEQS